MRNRKEMEKPTRGRKAQNPSFMLMAILFLVILIAIAVGVIVSQTSFVAKIEEHNQNRFAILVATRLTSSPSFLMDTGQQQGLHKNVVDSRKLDRANKNYLRLLLQEGETETPYELRTRCYTWFATVRDPSEGKLWVFGDSSTLSTDLKSEFQYLAAAVKDDPWGYLSDAYFGNLLGTLGGPIGGTIGASIAVGNKYFDDRLTWMGGYTIPVAIATYRGNQIQKYDFGTIQVNVKKTGDCADDDVLEREYTQAVSMINRFYETPRAIEGAQTSYSEKFLPYVLRSDPQRRVSRYLRCEELPVERISENFPREEAEAIDSLKGATASDGTPVTEKIEGVSVQAGIDPNLVRAVLFVETGMDPATINSIDFEALANGLRANADYFSDKLAASQCIVNYAAYAHVAGAGQTELYIDGTEVPDPRSNIRASAEKIISHYNAFSSCWGIDNGGGGAGA